MLDYMQISKLIAGLNSQQAADKLMAMHPEMDPAPLVKAFTMQDAGLPGVDLGSGPAGVTPPGPMPGLGGAPVGGANPFAAFNALGGAQTLLQQPKAQYVQPGAPKVGGAAPAQVHNTLPPPTTDFSFGQLMGGRRRAS